MGRRRPDSTGLSWDMLVTRVIAGVCSSLGRSYAAVFALVFLLHSCSAGLLICYITDFPRCSVASLLFCHLPPSSMSMLVATAAGSQKLLVPFLE